MEFLSSAILPAAFIFPVLGGILLLLLPARKLNEICQATFFTTVVTFLLVLTAALPGMGLFDWSRPGEQQLNYEFPWVPAFGLRFVGSVDALSMWFLLLTTFIMPLVMLESFTHLRERVGYRAKEFFFWLLWAEASMIAAFTATDLIYFYVCYEFTLIPLFFLIGVFGGANRLRAASVYFIYSFTGSMLMLAGILYLAWFNAHLSPGQMADIASRMSTDGLALGEWSLDFATILAASSQLSVTEQLFLLGALLAGFAVKVPLFPVHTWLPLAHTEAPTAGSVDLAAVMLKLGTYGILRFTLPTVPVAVVDSARILSILGVIGILYAAMICWVQKDMKKLIAYSSVSHMGFCVLGMFALETTATTGAAFYMLAHGLSTGALFLCVGMMYTRLHTRQMSEVGGLMKVMPVWSFFLIFFAFASVGLPGLNGFVGEFLVLLGTFRADAALGAGWVFALLAGLGMILAAMYLLTMIARVCFGPVKIPKTREHVIERHDLTAKEVWTLAPIALVCLVTGIYPTPILRSVEACVQPILRPAELVMQERSNDLRLINSPIVVTPDEPLITPAPTDEPAPRLASTHEAHEEVTP
ncbi:MAG: NADH-quinone oxidoreductase subunit M [Planctomycetota bacterium]